MIEVLWTMSKKACTYFMKIPDIYSVWSLMKNKLTKADVCISIFPVMAESLLFYHQWPILSEGKSAYANTDVD